MFGTVIIDAYRKEEALEMADAIDDLCSPTDNYGWASAGIYCFWDHIQYRYYHGISRRRSADTDPTDQGKWWK